MRTTYSISSLVAVCLSPVYSYQVLPEYLSTLQQKSLLPSNDNGFGQNEPFIPTPEHLLPYKKPFEIDESKNYYKGYVNGSENGHVRRSSCPAVNVLANRGYINRDGRNVSYSELAHAVREVWNFGDDNVSTRMDGWYLA